MDEVKWKLVLAGVWIVITSGRLLTKFTSIADVFLVVFIYFLLDEVVQGQILTNELLSFWVFFFLPTNKILHLIWFFFLLNNVQWNRHICNEVKISKIFLLNENKIYIYFLIFSVNYCCRQMSTLNGFLQKYF